MSAPNFEDSVIRAQDYNDILSITEKYNEDWNLPRISRNGDSEPPLQAFYRGQANEAWRIEPSINRATDTEIVEYERRIKLLDKSISLFDQIAHIQHYDTKTRFIDFTTDIDIALYFACEKEFETDGAVFIWSYAPHKPEWYTTYIICELERLRDRDTVTVRELSELIYKNHPSIIHKFEDIIDLDGAIMSFLKYGIMVIPDKTTKLHNERLLRQKGAFFICPPQFVNSDNYQTNIASMAGQQAFYPKKAIRLFDRWNKHSLAKIIIPKEIKKDILITLQNNGITEDYLKPEY